MVISHDKWPQEVLDAFKRAADEEQDWWWKELTVPGNTGVQTVTTTGTSGDLPATPTVVVDFPDHPPAQQLNVNVWNGIEYVPSTPMTPQPDWSQFTWDFQPVVPAAPRRRTRRSRRKVAAKPVPLDTGRRSIDLDM